MKTYFERIKRVMLIIFKLLLIIIIALILLKSNCRTPGIHDGIAEIRKIKLGGLYQYVLIRGDSVHNPILLYLHSGPGTTEMISFRKAHKELEKFFTIVIWEQRGTGKSFSSKIPENSMSIEQLVSDAHELTEYLKREFKKEKIAVAGHSWGTALGLRLVKKYPDSFCAYVGSGQIVKPSEGEKIGYNYILEKAKGNASALKELENLGSPDPYLTIDIYGKWFEKIKTERKWLVKFGGETYKGSDNSLLFNLGTILAPEYTWVDYIRFGKGSTFSLKRIWPEVMKLDFFQQIPEVKVPVYIFQGRHDYNTPSTLVEKYFSILRAPHKELVWFENSGHHPMYEEPDKYGRILVEKVLPLCR